MTTRLPEPPESRAPSPGFSSRLAAPCASPAFARSLASPSPCALALTLSSSVLTQRAPRARDLGVPFDGTPGAGNAITDVAGVTVGHATIIAGEGALTVGKGPVRTGVTAVLPRGRDSMAKPCVCRLVLAERQRRDDRHHLGRGVGLPRRPGDDHQHAQRRRGARRGDRVADQERPARRLGLLVVAAGGGRDLRRLAERHQRLPREGAPRLRGARRRAAAARSRRATSAAAPAWWPTASRAASARRRGWSKTGGASYTVGVLVQANFGRRPQLHDRRRAGGPGDSGDAGPGGQRRD